MTLQQSFAWWSFSSQQDIEPRALLEGAASIGYAGVEMLPRALWPIAAAAGLALVNIAGHADLDVGFNDARNHAALRDEVRRNLDDAASESIGALIVFAGRRNGIDDDTGAARTVDGLAPLAAEAAAAGVTLLLELLNSKVDHPDHQCDHTDWGVQVVHQVDSPGLRLLYDCYHMQIMEGDVTHTISRNHAWIAHVHTAGVPGRRDLDEEQELHYPSIIRALSRTGYSGYVGHEFLPRGEPVAALRAAYELVATSSS